MLCPKCSSYMSKIEVRKQNFYDIKLISYILLIGLITFAVGLLGKEKLHFDVIIVDILLQNNLI